MSFVVEDGTGLPDANSYASVEEADAHHGNSLNADAWEDVGGTPEKQRKLVAATRLLDTLFDWNGEVFHFDQALGFPRRALLDPRGSRRLVRGVPRPIKIAAIDLALWIQDDAAAAAATTEAVEEISLGPIGIKLAVPEQAAAVTRPLMPSPIIISLRHWGDYIGGGTGMGRLIR